MPNPNEGLNFISGVNHRVDSMELHTHVGSDGVTRSDLGAPSAANATAIFSAQSVAAAGTFTPAAGTITTDAKYGRAVAVVLSGAGTPTITVRGRDYLGQPMAEQFTGNGTTPVNGKKAFKTVESVQSTLVAGTTMNVGWIDVFGLPFNSEQLLQESVDQRATGNAGTFVAAITTDPQTATTGDPRGTYAPNAANAANGVRAYRLLIQCHKNNLHGVKHFYA
jgi:hypothetical protein